MARTAHGALLTAASLRPLLDEARLIPVAVTPTGAVTATADQPRLATPTHRRALAARDGGCSFPGCDIPPAWCQAHHVIAWQDHGPTEIANLTLLCGHHHRNHETTGWHCHMQDGIPWWTPPRWIDPDRTPRRNTTHHPPIHFPHVEAAGEASSPIGDFPDRNSAMSPPGFAPSDPTAGPTG